MTCGGNTTLPSASSSRHGVWLQVWKHNRRLPIGLIAITEREEVQKIMYKHEIQAHFKLIILLFIYLFLIGLG